METIRSLTRPIGGLLALLLLGAMAGAILIGDAAFNSSPAECSSPIARCGSRCITPDLWFVSTRPPCWKPAERAAALEEGLTEAEISGPYVLVAAVDGVHSARLFAEGRSDIAGVVLVDPIPIGFRDFYDELLPDLDGHPPWADLEETVAGDLGDTPLLVIGHDPTAVFLSRKFIEEAGAEAATTLNRYWREGLEFYSGLSTNSRPLEAEKTGLDYVLWARPDLVVEAVIEVSTNL